VARDCLQQGDQIYALERDQDSLINGGKDPKEHLILLESI